MNAIVLMSDPKVAAVPLIESGERLVDVRPGGRLLVDTRKQDQSDAFAHLREGVLERLLTAQTMLPSDIRLLFVEGYRPPSLQREYFEKYAGRLRAANPGWSSHEIHSAASRYVSPPTSRRTAPARPSTSPSPTPTDTNWTSARA